MAAMASIHQLLHQLLCLAAVRRLCGGELRCLSLLTARGCVVAADAVSHALELADEAVAAARVVVGSSDEPVGAEALLQVACTLRRIDVYSAGMGGSLE